MNLFRRLSPAFWRFDFSIHSSAAQAPVLIEVETVDCPVCEQPVDVGSRSELWDAIRSRESSN